MRAALTALGIGVGCGTFIVVVTLLGMKIARWLAKELEL